MKYFPDVRGAIDETHMEAHIPLKFQTRFRNREGTLSHNVLFSVALYSDGQEWKFENAVKIRDNIDGKVEGKGEKLRKWWY